MARKTNCTKNGKDYYRVTATVGRDAMGKPIRKEFYGISQKVAVAKRDAYLNAMKEGLKVDLAKQTVAKAMYTWLYEVKKPDSKVKATTFSLYEANYRLFIKDSILGSIRVSEVASIDVQRHLNALADKNPNNTSGKSCSYTKLKYIHLILKMFFNYATEEGYTKANPCSKISIPGEKKSLKAREITTFSDEEITRIKATSNKNRLRLAVLLSIGTGLRKGEVLALTYDDIKDGVIDVNKSLLSYEDKHADGTKTRILMIGEPKSEHSYRQVPLPKELEKEINMHKKQQISERLQQGVGGEPKYLFTTKPGHFYEPSSFQRGYSRLLNKAGVPYKKFHTCRHTFASRLVMGNPPTPLPVAQKLLGHADIATTSIYLHDDMEARNKAVQTLNYMFR